MTGQKYIRSIPKSLPSGVVLVHNQVLPRPRIGQWGFRAWIQPLDDTLMLCPCKWAGAELHGMAHYRMAVTGPDWEWEDEAKAERARRDD